MSTIPLITRVVLQNYRSIASCDVRLGRLTFLVGRNGSGKSNFLNALGLVGEALRDSLGTALERRVGLVSLLSRVPPFVQSCGIRLEFQLESGATGHYSLLLSLGESGGATVEREECRIGGDAYFAVSAGKVEGSASVMPRAVQNRLYLVNASGLEAFSAVYDLLSGVRILSPRADLEARIATSMTAAQRSLGYNLVEMYLHLRERDPASANAVREYLSQIAEDFADFDVADTPGHKHLLFQERVSNELVLGRMFTEVSDGTYRAATVLLSLFSGLRASSDALPLGVEEPEAGLHPGAAGVIRDALCHASVRRQIIASTHSADLLDDKDIDQKSILVVRREKGTTHIAPLSGAAQSILRDHLFTAGELLRQGGMEPETGTKEQPALFDEALVR